MRLLLLVVLTLTLLALAGCEKMVDPRRPPEMVDPEPEPPDVAHARRWWNVLTPEQRGAALYGNDAAELAGYADLDAVTKEAANAAAAEIYGDGDHESVAAWWATLDCRQRRIAVGEGNTDDPSSPYCRDYPAA